MFFPKKASVKKDEDEPHVERLVVTRTEDRELQLMCSAAGLPPPDIQIYKLDEAGAYQLLEASNNPLQNKSLTMRF